MLLASPARAHRSTADARPPPAPDRRTVAAAALALTLLLAGAPFLPDSSSRPGPVAPGGETARALPGGAAGAGSVTPAMRAEIERVVAEGARRRVGRSGTYALARAAARCATFEGQRYCLGLGWTTSTQEAAAARLAGAATTASRRRRSTSTGDLDADGDAAPAPALARRRTRRRGAGRAHACRALGRQGVAAPPRDPGRPAAGRLPGAAPRGGDWTARSTARRFGETTRESSRSSARSRSAPQNLTYYCGPTTMQMIGWGWRDRRQAQSLWADRSTPPRPARRSPTWSGSSTTTPARTARTTPGPTSCWTSATSPSSSGGG